MKYPLFYIMADVFPKVCMATSLLLTFSKIPRKQDYDTWSMIHDRLLLNELKQSILGIYL